MRRVLRLQRNVGGGRGGQTVRRLMTAGRTHLVEVVTDQMDTRTHLIAVLHALGYSTRWEARLRELHRWCPDWGRLQPGGGYTYGEDSEADEDPALNWLGEIKLHT